MGLAVVRPRAVLALVWPLVVAPSAYADLAECEEPAVAAGV